MKSCVKLKFFCLLNLYLFEPRLITSVEKEFIDQAFQDLCWVWAALCKKFEVEPQDFKNKEQALVL
jgi:hypothetical protein